LKQDWADSTITEFTAKLPQEKQDELQQTGVTQEDIQNLNSTDKKKKDSALRKIKTLISGKSSLILTMLLISVGALSATNKESH
jgi:hypothetical protein